jgi:hypothetical protein
MRGGANAADVMTPAATNAIDPAHQGQVGDTTPRFGEDSRASTVSTGRASGQDGAGAAAAGVGGSGGAAMLAPMEPDEADEPDGAALAMAVALGALGFVGRVFTGLLIVSAWAVEDGVGTATGAPAS